MRRIVLSPGESIRPSIVEAALNANRRAPPMNYFTPGYVRAKIAAPGLSTPVLRCCAARAQFS
jgi:hypothetical protein